jgi:hypothetical protein
LSSSPLTAGFSTDLALGSGEPNEHARLALGRGSAAKNIVLYNDPPEYAIRQNTRPRLTAFDD